MKTCTAMAVAKLAAVIVGVAAALPSVHEPSQAVAANKVLRRLRPGKEQHDLGLVSDQTDIRLASDEVEPEIDLKRVSDQIDKIALNRPQLGLIGGKSQVTRKRRMSLGVRDDVPEELEAWYDSGNAVQSMMETTDLIKLTSGITPEKYAAELHAIVDPSPSRFIAFKGNKKAAFNIKKEFDDLGLETEIQPLGVSEKLSKLSIPTAFQQKMPGNVLGFLKGGDKAHEVVIVGCHYDSVNWENIMGAAPGVDDNASGCALMLMLAKTLSVGTKPRRSILFVSFQAEEEGLVGSRKLAELFKPGGVGLSKWGKPVAAIVADEVAWPGTDAAGRQVIFETKGRGKDTNAVVDTLAHASQQQCSGGFKDCVNGFVVNFAGFGSDHIPLLEVGVPAVLMIERDNQNHATKYGHSERDTFEHVDTAYGAAMTRTALQAVATLANPKM